MAYPRADHCHHAFAQGQVATGMVEGAAPDQHGLDLPVVVAVPARAAVVAGRLAEVVDQDQ